MILVLFQLSVSSADLDAALFAQLVNLAKFNTRFQMEANKRQPWRDVLYPATREAGTGVSFAATLIDMREQAQGLHNPRAVSRGALKDAINCAIIGNSISAGASAAELAQNTWSMLEARRHGYSPKASLTYVKEIAAETDRLLRLREDKARERPTAQQREVAEMENMMIRRIRNQLLVEYANWSAHSLERTYRENTFYALDSGSSFTRLGASIVTRKAFGHPSLARTAAVTALTANSISTATPILSDLAGRFARKHRERKLIKELGVSADDEDKEIASLHSRLANAEEPWLARLSELHVRSHKIDGELQRETAQIARYREIAQQQRISGTAIGLTGIASSALANVAVYRYITEPQVSIRLGLAGRITQGTGQAFALLYTPYTFAKGFARRRALRAKGQLPSQILDHRLKELEALSK